MDVMVVLDERWFPRRCLRSFFEMQGLDRAMVVASQAFTALIPLMILVSAVLPSVDGGSMGELVVRSLLRALPFDGPLSLVVSFAAGAVLWTSIPWLLLNRRLPWRRLVPAGILTGTLTTAWGFATTIYMPRLMTSYSERYGLFGITIALVGWLLAISFIVVVSTVIAAELDRSPERWASVLRWPGIDGPAGGPSHQAPPAGSSSSVGPESSGAGRG